ncbi:aldose epimerase family protein [Oceanivirga miroungae]|uniref:Aldose 1-epimerase n=1 Tax=Oceanivirga miroungae TaxID=1130046 RepID=A0A6I8MBP9_9FUSO|nr:hypothetical protein [Oceanivirga miroungae]VWL84847.1 Aldose 1-epimerase [Oceanivirga miroungae]
MITEFNLGNEVKRFILKKDNNFEVHILNYGCIIERIIYKGQNMVLSYSDFNLYKNNSSFAGAIVGRSSGRMKDHKYVLNGKEYILDLTEEDRNTNLHGGSEGYSNKIFDSKIEGNKLILTYVDDNKIYENKAYIKATYYLDENLDRLNVIYEANTEKDGYINMTNHSYFNLGNEEDIKNHEIELNANYYWDLEKNMTPLKRTNVENTIFDFRKSKNLLESTNEVHEQFDITYYYDHPFELNKEKEYDLILRNTKNNISMELRTNQKCVVMYTGNFLHQVPTFSGYSENKRFQGVALEPQNLPNGINISKDYYEITNKENPYIEKISYTFKGGNI